MTLKNIARLSRDVMEKKFLFPPETSRDIYLASYPRSGNTWLRAVCFHLSVGREPKSIEELGYAVVDLHARPLRHRMIDQPRYVIKTHYQADYNTKHSQVLYVVRDPRDVIPSYYRYHQKNKGETGSFETFARAVIHGAMWPGSWYDNVKSWMFYGNIYPNIFHMAIYRDLVSRKETAVANLATFLGSSEQKTGEVMALYDFDKMKELESKGRHDRRSKGQTQWFTGSGIASTDQAAVVESIIYAEAPHYMDLMREIGFEI